MYRFFNNRTINYGVPVFNLYTELNIVSSELQELENGRNRDMYR